MREQRRMEAEQQWHSTLRLACIDWLCAGRLNFAKESAQERTNARHCSYEEEHSKKEKEVFCSFKKKTMFFLNACC
jgi:hypothetical protein